MFKDTWLFWGSNLWPSRYRTVSLTTEEALLAAVLFDMSDGRRGPHSRLSLYQWCERRVRTGRLPPEKERTPPINTFICHEGVQAACICKHACFCLKEVLLLGGDDHVAFGLVVVAHALHGIDLGQLVDDLTVFSVHGRETVAPL